MEIKVLVIAGPSAVGKTTVSDLLLGEGSRFRLSRSVTTRAPRGDGFDDEYIYLSREEFCSLRESGGLLEWTEYSGDLYGTPYSELERITSEGAVPLLILDLAGVRSVGESARGINACTLYIFDDLNVMEDRLYRRYLATEPTAKKLKSFVDRKNKNIADYLELPQLCKYLFAFIRNSNEPSATADEVLASFERFVSGADRDCNSITSTALALARSAEEKQCGVPRE